MKFCLSLFFLFVFSTLTYAQVPTDPPKQPPVPTEHPPTFLIPDVAPDTPLRIKNLNPYFTIHVDSSLRYQFEINKDLNKYYWFLKNQPVGLSLNKDNGMLSFRGQKSYFLSGRLKYDTDYNVQLTVQNLDDPRDKIDTSFVIQFYNTEVIQSRIKPFITPVVNIDEGDTLSFSIGCVSGNFPIEEITYVSDYNVRSVTPVRKCGDIFTWVVPYDFVRPTDKDKQKKLSIYLVGTSKFQLNDTSIIQVYVKDNINYVEQVAEFNNIKSEIERYISQLKNSFGVVDRKIKRTRSTRTTFELTTATTALSGTILSSLPETRDGSSGKILPSVGVAMVPVKEAVAPNSNYNQNMASQIRSTINRLEYLLSNIRLIGNRDPDILQKSARLREELNQAQVQLIDIPLADPSVDARTAEDYYNDPKVQRKYRLRKK